MHSSNPTIQIDRESLLRRLAGRPIVFIGLMGAGKTVIGRQIADLLAIPFVDSDEEIEQVSRMTIPELFERYGEAEFRELEQRVIKRLLRPGPRVLSTGGGAYMNAATRRQIARRGISIWLRADLDTLMARVMRKRNRPLLQNDDPRATMERLMALRYPVYAEADITIDTRNDRKEVVVEAVLEALDRFLDQGKQDGRERR